jgi:DNA-directed RNA polymerase specialized sigma24 family protein
VSSSTQLSSPHEFDAPPPVPFDFVTFVSRYSPRLRALVLRRIGDPHEADEITQEALLRAHQHRRRFADEDGAAWTTVVAQRLVVDRQLDAAAADASLLISGRIGFGLVVYRGKALVVGSRTTSRRAAVPDVRHRLRDKEVEAVPAELDDPTHYGSGRRTRAATRSCGTAGWKRKASHWKPSRTGGSWTPTSTGS